MTISPNPIPNQAPAPTLSLPEMSPTALSIRRAPKITDQTHRTRQLLLDLAIGKSEEEKEPISNPSSSTNRLAFSVKSFKGIYTEEEIQRFKAIYERDLARVKAITSRPPPPASSCILL